MRRMKIAILRPVPPAQTGGRNKFETYVVTGADVGTAEAEDISAGDVSAGLERMALSVVSTPKTAVIKIGWRVVVGGQMSVVESVDRRPGDLGHRLKLIVRRLAR